MSAYAGDCGQYLICLWGKFEPFQCAAGLHWNAVRIINIAKHLIYIFIKFYI